MATTNFKIKQQQTATEIIEKSTQNDDVNKKQKDVKEQQTMDETLQDKEQQSKYVAEENINKKQQKEDEQQKMEVPVDNDEMDEFAICDKITVIENNDKSSAQQKKDSVNVVVKEEHEIITTATENTEKFEECKHEIVAAQNNSYVDFECCKKSKDIDKMQEIEINKSKIKMEMLHEIENNTSKQQKMDVNDENNDIDDIKCEKMHEDASETTNETIEQMKLNNSTTATTNTNDETSIKSKEDENEDIGEGEVEEEVENFEKITSLKSLGPFIAAKNNTNNTIYINDFPEICKKQPCMLGVDEAGRGPVLGPMVYGIAFCPLENEQSLIDLGCADSKQLTEEKREIIFNNINTLDYAKNCIGWAIDIISPNIISTSMNRRSKCSLNEVSMNSAIGLINLAIDAGVNVAAIFVDTVGPPEKYEQKLKSLFPNVEKITVAKKADSTYPIVSAASICAKVTRDHALKVWKFPEGINLTSTDFGSGYPGDPVTKQFLCNNIDNVFGFPRLVRFSWSTAENALADVAYEMEFDEPDNEKTTIKYAGAKLTQFFKQQQQQQGRSAAKRQRCRFYKERFLDNVTEF